VAESYKKKGFENVKALKGGVSAWKDAGYPFV
jgi:rhodanese-related sulfurtransferase